ncbi:MAG TPA: maleylpyruvate isomerase N-terminal domain-containing protein [Actinomycetota bacterium]|nr:maleylpyruvate isomerase N-terminal domain-containing protein [Actinomycetota bacterium]
MDQQGAAQTGRDPALWSLIGDERRGWEELMALLGSLTREQMLLPGYFGEGWSVKDLLAHIAGWLAEAGLALQQIRAGTFRARDLDVDAMNAVFLDANRSQPLTIVEAEAHAARHRLLLQVHELEGVTGDAAFWLRKAGPEHYDEHLPRLEEWVKDLHPGFSAGW